MTIRDLANIAIGVTNDMKYIHLHACGHIFDNVHDIANHYYSEASDNYDLLAELAIEVGEDIENPSLACEAIGYIPSTIIINNEIDSFTEIADIINYYIVDIETIINENIYDSDIINKLQEIARFWKKENDYKMEARLS